ncbi:MAG: type II toxin-antitoxin system VapC family toxin [Candidatus Kapaibacterium sp.]
MEIYADTSYWVALLLPSDDFHEAATAYSDALPQNTRLVTSELVMVELLNFVCDIDPMLRREASTLWHGMMRNPNFEIVATSAALLESAHTMYDKFSDKSWSLTDCASFQIMRDRKIVEALTADHHFEQAGFRALLQ